MPQVVVSRRPVWTSSVLLKPWLDALAMRETLTSADSGVVSALTVVLALERRDVPADSPSGLGGDAALLAAGELSQPVEIVARERPVDHLALGVFRGTQAANLTVV
jgi:hypothetical protein